MEGKTVSGADWRRLEEAAAKASNSAYAPYSMFPVGAAILLDNGQIYAGCNVENASFGLTICAERNAVFQAVAASGGAKPRILAAFVHVAKGDQGAPCGACRQVLWEFGPDSIVRFKHNGSVETLTLAQLLPKGFNFA